MSVEIVGDGGNLGTRAEILLSCRLFSLGLDDRASWVRVGSSLSLSWSLWVLVDLACLILHGLSSITASADAAVVDVVGAVVLLESSS